MSAASIAGIVVVAFFVGAIPFGVVVSRLFYGTDLRASGSGNIGAANALRTLGKRGAAAVLVLDALKGYLPALAAWGFGGPLAAVIAAFAAMLGHCYSPFLGGKGGKGVATLFGTLFALWWPAAVAFALVWIAAVAATGYSSVGSMLGTIASAAALWYGLGWEGLWYGLAAVVLIVYKHRGNLVRLRSGTENRLPLLKPRRS
jgi:glycerol-3-phosphate acyltransferase PlsY